MLEKTMNDNGRWIYKFKKIMWSRTWKKKKKASREKSNWKKKKSILNQDTKTIKTE